MNLNNFVQNLTTHKNSNYSLWRGVKKFSTPIQSEPALRLPNGKWAKSDEEKVDAFSQRLSNVFQPNPPSNLFEMPLLPIEPSSEPLQIKQKDISAVLKAPTKKKVSSGYDGITLKMVIELPPLAIRMLTYIYNAILRLSYFPTIWKISEVIMIP